MAITTSILRGGSNSHETTSEEANGVYTDFVSQGILGTTANTSGVAPATGGYAVNAQGTPDMTVAVSSGTAYVTATPSTQNSQTFRVVNSAVSNVTIAANSSGSTKYDWIYLKLDATNLNTPNTAGTDAATLVASRSSSISSDDGTPPTYGTLLAIVTVSNGAATITNGNIKDLRTNASIGASTTDSTGWYNLGATPNTVTYNGNRSYTLVFNSNDLTDTLSEGMRLRLTRTVSAPTQCADLEASSSQYFSSASAGLAGVTFTDDFTIMAWVKLESYGLSYVLNRQSAAAGWALRLTASGQVEIFGGTGSAFDLNTTYQSIPLGKWVHIAATLDMSTGTAGGSPIYIDGVAVPNFYTSSAASSLTQTGDLRVGSDHTPANFFDGKIAQVAVFSSILSAATIRSYMSQGLSGSESTLVSAFSCSNSLLDLNTTNNNDLTANGGALMTNVDSPFGNYLGGTLEYAIISAKPTFSTNTTVTVQVPEGCAIPTSGGVSAVAYSTQGNPYLFPTGKGRYGIRILLKTQQNTGSIASSATITNIVGMYIEPPIGIFNVGYNLLSQNTHAGATNLSTDVGLSTGTTTFSDPDLVTRSAQVSTSVVEVDSTHMRNKEIQFTTATKYYLNLKSSQNNSTLYYNGSSGGSCELFAEFNLL